MIFDGEIPVATANVGADPIAAPEDVLGNAVITAKSQRSDRMVSRWLLFVAGAAAQTLDVELYTLVEAFEIAGAPKTPPADRVWALFGSPTLVANVLTEVLSGPPGGVVYVRVTGGGTLVGDQTLRIACVD